MLRAVVLLAAVCFVLGDDFAEKYAYSKVMTNCVGDDRYYGFIKETLKAVKECYSEEIDLPEDDDTSESSEEDEGAAPLDFDRFGGRPVFLLLSNRGGDFDFSKLLSGRQKREATYSAPVLQKMVEKVKAKVSNFTCTLRKMGQIDDDFNLRFDVIEKAIRNFDVSAEIKGDLIQALESCEKLTTCLPEKSPMPIKIQRLIAMNKCWRKARMAVCMKQDFIKYLDEFDLSEFPEDENDEDGEKAEKLLHIFWGIEAKDDFQLY